TVIDGVTNTTTTVTAGTNPNAIAVNPVTNKVYVANLNSNDVTVIDGTTNATTTVTAGTLPYAIAVNPVTNKVYVANFGSNNVTVIDGATNTTTTVAAGTSPVAIAVNPVTNKVYVANQISNNVTVIDGVTNTPTIVTVGTSPYAIAVNPVTNKVYVANQLSYNVTVIDVASNTTTTVTTGKRHNAIAVHPVTNKVYVTNQNSTNVTVIDGVTNTPTIVTTGKSPYAIAVNPVTNKVYVANYFSDNVTTVIDGVTNTTTTVTAGTNPNAIAVNPVTNKVYVANSGSDNVTVISPSIDTALPLTTAVTSSSLVNVAGISNATVSSAPAFTFTATSTYAPTAPAIRTVYYQVDSASGPWIQASGAGPFTATLPAQSKGDHVLYAFAVDGLEGGATAGSSGEGSGNSPMVGSVAAFAFSVIDPLAQIITFGANPGPVNYSPSGTFTVSATGGASGNAVSFTSTTTGVCTISGTTVTMVTAGTCTIAANQAGNTDFTAAAQVTQSITINPILPCTPGNFSATGNAPCTPAPAGSFVPTAGATAAIACAIGSYQPNSGSISCTLASVGFFVPLTASTSQTPCPLGSTTLITGASACLNLPLLNIDNSDPATVYDANTDAVLLTRYLLGYRNADLIANARGTGANLRDAAQIETHLSTYIPTNQALSPFDVDGDGVVLPMTDGLMILRRLLNPNALNVMTAAEQSAITANAKRGSLTDAQVLQRIEALKP
ncbi:MAG: hypothetical protein EAZ43_15085, partial [Betaproteobacteria bacterium]